MPHARIPEIAIGKARAAEKEHLEKPEQDDRDLAEKERALHVGRDENIVQHEQREGKYGGYAQDVQRVGQRNEPPFGRGQMEEETNDDAERDEIGQDAKQQRQTVGQEFAFEAQKETCQQRQRGRQRVMRGDQRIAPGQV